MSASTSSYSSLLDGTWAPDGGVLSESLKRLQNLEKMRKDREATRQAMMKDRQGDSTTFGIVKTSRLRSTNTGDSSYGPGLRRALSVNENSSYGGARPKLGNYRLNTEPILGTTDVGDIFGDIKAEILASARKPMWSEKQYETRNRFGSSDSEDSYTGSKYDYSRSEAIMKKYANGGPYTSRYANKETNGQNGNSGDYTTEQGIDSSETDNHDEMEQHNDTFEDDEEPKHFIERLKLGNHENDDSTRSQNSAFILNPIPTLPPYRHLDNNKPADLPELVQPTDDIVSVAQDINATFGVTSPELSPSKSPNKSKLHANGKQSNKTTSKKKSSKKIAPEIPAKPVNSKSATDDNGFSADLDSSVTYVIEEVDNDSSGDDRGKTLPVRESFYNSRPSEWGVIASTPGKIDQMHEFFTGDDIGDDPNISRELDGETIKAEFERSFSEVKSKKSDQSKTSASAKKSGEKEKLKNGRRSKSPLDRLKNSVLRSSESENDSVYTSGSESDIKTNGKKNKKASKIGTNSKKEEKKELSIGDKLAKLESMTQEKKRKHSISEKDETKPVPSYMSGTNASQQKRSKNKVATTPSTAATPTHDLKKDVRELKQYVREHSNPSTPVDSPVKSFTDMFGTPRQVKVPTREISIQTEFVIDFPDINYVCKHCGKSSFEEVTSPPLTVENINKSQKKLNGKKETKSTGSVKSLGDNSTKSERTTRYIKKTTTAAGLSYMKGTTSSRLKNSGPPSEGERVRKGSAPELVHKMEHESNSGGKGTSLRGTVSQRAKAFENVNKPNRAKSSDRKTAAGDKGKLRKSKSVDHVSAAMTELSLPQDGADDLETTLTGNEAIQPETSPKSNTEPDAMTNNHMNQPEKNSQPANDAAVVSPQPLKPQVEVGKLDLSALETPPSPSLRKPPLSSPRIRDVDFSPRGETHDIEEVVVESKGQFTSIGDNPFIKQDGGSRTRTRSRETMGESVWEKAEGRSRESSLKRTNSSSTGERPNSASSLKRHNTSAGEKSSVSELTWSDSGSTESLSKWSKSSLHGSNASLNKDGDRSVFHRPRTTSISSVTSQNTMLNLLSPSASSRHPVSGAIETDVDAAYYDHINELKPDTSEAAHNEETVNKTHLEFAKNACNMLEFETKKRDSSNESEKGTKDIKENIENSADLVAVNGSHDNNITTASETKPSKKDKKKGLFKGKFFKK